MKELMIARETAENIAECIEAHTQSSHMKAVASEIRRLVAEAEELGYLVITAHKKVTADCACGCGRLFIPAKNGRMRIYYNDACRQRASRKKRGRVVAWTAAEEKALLKGLEGDLSAQQVANSLGRSIKSVRSKHAELKRKGLGR